VATDLEQGLRNGSPGAAGEDADLVDHPRPRLAGPFETSGPASAIGRDRSRCREQAEQERGERAAEDQGPGRRAEDEEGAERGDELDGADLAEPGLGQPVAGAVTRA
jgi:hypothetical protein